ncbi:MAG: BREX system P-loop protein BrxC, partial [Deltaproteobacteria bacterium]|nr:BREX system P-loop protein BrxC [Deltaproteobacteria bacterium]
MQIKEIFKKDISRPINGVVKADQLDEAVVWQELDEYVVTRELDKHLRKFISAYLSAIDNTHDPVITSRIGVWVSGFFGSGKSHFIKILSYLLGNHNTVNPETGAEKKAVDFFNDKITDPMLLGDLKRIANIDAEIILFNIDSKADSNDGRSAVLSTFWRVFNESQGFCGDYLHLSEIERYLVKKGKYDEFKNKFFERNASKWEEERDAYALYQDEIVETLSMVLGKSAQAVTDWIEKAENEFNLTVENFAKRIREYLNSRSQNYRIVFLVDEIGQFIGNDTHLMLNLQTIVEDLGRIYNGQVWVIVTSQEDIDAVLGDIKASKANDFSKIQGRFNTRLSLSSSNTDEVIQARLLEKTKAAEIELDDLFKEKGDILKSQLSFSHDSTTLKKFSDSNIFKVNYPFTPFHFQLVQNIFESIRKAGATGLHLARGERSMLDAFQSAAISLSSKDIGALVPLYEFFPSIENFLDTAVMLSINNAGENFSLEMPFDLHLLQTLFLIRYVKLIKPNVNNLVTLCIDQVDADRISLKQKIEASLERLEKQNLINRNGDLYFFLTNDEQEVSREIKNVEIPSGAESQFLGEIIFDDILKGKSKHRYIPYKNDYSFSRICDDRIWGKELKDELGIEIISPLHDEYDLFIPAKCNLYSANKDGHVIAKLVDDKNLINEIRIYLQTVRYIMDKSDAAASTNLKQILRDRADENRTRKNRLIDMVDIMLGQAEYFALGKGLEIKGQTTSKILDEAFDHLIQNVFSKYSYLTIQFDEPLKEIKHVLLSDDIIQQQLMMEFEKAEPLDIKEIRTFIDLKTAGNQLVILSELVRHFAGRPYGWGELQTVILIAKLFMSGSISLVADGA